MDTILCKEEILKNAVEAVNELHKYIRLMVPKYQEYLAKGFKINQTYEFSKKDTMALRTLGASFSKATEIRSTFLVKKYHIAILFETHYQTGDHGCAYYEKLVYLQQFNHSKTSWEACSFVPENFRTDFTVKEVLGIKTAVAVFEKEKQELEEKISGIKSNYKAFFK